MIVQCLGNTMTSGLFYGLENAKMMISWHLPHSCAQEEFGFQSLPGLLGLNGWGECFRVGC